MGATSPTTFHALVIDPVFEADLIRYRFGRLGEKLLHKILATFQRPLFVRFLVLHDGLQTSPLAVQWLDGRAQSDVMVIVGMTGERPYGLY